eukprot:s3488_g7.t1
MNSFELRTGAVLTARGSVVVQVSHRCIDSRSFLQGCSGKDDRADKVLTTALSIMYFGLQLNGTFLVGVVTVCYSIFLYGGARVLPFWDARGTRSKAN